MVRNTKPPSRARGELTPHLKLRSSEALAEHLKKLLKRDRRLGPINKVAGPFPPRVHEPGFAGLARIIVGQQVSTASAKAIWGRLEAIPGATTPEGFLQLGEKGVAGVGFSRSKLRTVTTIAEAIVKGDLHLVGLEELEAEHAIAELTKLKGIGPWTAEIYLMFCAGHPDIFPAGDLALQKAVGDAFAIAPPDRKTLITIAQAWSPHRSTAALLFWRFYAARKNRDAVPL